MCLKYLTLLTLGFSVLSGMSAARAQTEHGIALGVTIGTTGLGVAAIIQIIPKTLNLSAGITGLSVGYTSHVTTGDVVSNYDATFRLLGAPIILEYYPFHTSFNLQGGVFINGNKISYDSKQMHKGTEMNDVTGSTHLNIVAPYVGIGFGQPFGHSRLTFTGSLGLEYAGAPDVSLHQTPSMGPQAEAQLNASAKQLDDNLRWAEFYPVASIGLAYRF